jgi:hypothetical protein
MWGALIVLGACKSSPPSASPDAKWSLDGTWPLTRNLTSCTCNPTQQCPGFTTGFQPSEMTIIGQTIGTDYGNPVMNVQWGGAHTLSFDEVEDWNTVGSNGNVTLHYDWDQSDMTTLDGVVTAMPVWPSGTCSFTYQILSHEGASS